jgi:hypothetical protein
MWCVALRPCVFLGWLLQETGRYAERISGLPAEHLGQRQHVLIGFFVAVFGACR